MPRPPLAPSIYWFQSLAFHWLYHHGLEYQLEYHFLNTSFSNLHCTAKSYTFLYAYLFNDKKNFRVYTAMDCMHKKLIDDVGMAA